MGYGREGELVIELNKNIHCIKGGDNWYLVSNLSYEFLIRWTKIIPF